MLSTAVAVRDLQQARHRASQPASGRQQGRQRPAIHAASGPRQRQRQQPWWQPAAARPLAGRHGGGSCRWRSPAAVRSCWCVAWQQQRRFGRRGARGAVACKRVCGAAAVERGWYRSARQQQQQQAREGVVAAVTLRTCACACHKLGALHATLRREIDLKLPGVSFSCDFAACLLLSEAVLRVLTRAADSTVSQQIKPSTTDGDSQRATGTY